MRTFPLPALKWQNKFDENKRETETEETKEFDDEIEIEKREFYPGRHVGI